MIVPSRRWFGGAALLAPVALFGWWWPPALSWLLVLDGAWLVLLAIEAWRVAGAPPGALQVHREAPAALSVGRAMPVAYRWTSRLPYGAAVRVVESLPAPLALSARALGAGAEARRLHLASGATVTEHLVVRPLARGRATTGALHAWLSSPWGLAWRRLHLPLPWQLTVYPALSGAALRSLPTQAQRRREAGMRRWRRPGEGHAFESLREYVAGDDPRSIDWKATARRARPMVRQYEDERRQHVLVAIDAGRLMTAHLGAAGARPRLDAVVDAALQLTHAAVDHDDDIGLLVFSDTVHQYLAPARGRRALRALLDALAVVEGRLVEPDYPAAFTFLAQRNRRRALTVVFTDVIDRTASDALVTHLGALHPRHLPLAVALRDPLLEQLATARPASTAAAFERAAAEELLQAREAALGEIRAGGVLVLDVPPAGAAEAVVAQYESLKRRGRL